MGSRLAVFAALAVFATATLSTSVAAATGIDEKCVGRWEGIGNNGGDDWTIVFVVSSTSGGTIDYPSLGCGGFVEDGHVDGDHVVMRERYTHNRGNCTPPGTIQAKCEGDTMEWAWAGSGFFVKSKLHRVGGAPGAPPAIATGAAVPSVLSPPVPSAPVPGPTPPQDVPAPKSGRCSMSPGVAPIQWSALVGFAAVAAGVRIRRSRKK